MLGGSGRVIGLAGPSETETEETRGGGGVLLLVRLLVRDDAPSWTFKPACLFIAARVAAPDVLRDPGDRWMR